MVVIILFLVLKSHGYYRWITLRPIKEIMVMATRKEGTDLKLETDIGRRSQVCLQVASEIQKIG